MPYREPTAWNLTRYCDSLRTGMGLFSAGVTRIVLTRVLTRVRTCEPSGPHRCSTDQRRRENRITRPLAIRVNVPKPRACPGASALDSISDMRLFGGNSRLDLWLETISLIWVVTRRSTQKAAYQGPGCAH